MMLRAVFLGICLKTCNSRFLALTAGSFKNISKSLKFSGTPGTWGFHCNFCIYSLVYVELLFLPFLSSNSTTLDGLVPNPQPSSILSSCFMPQLCREGSHRLWSIWLEGSTTRFCSLHSSPTPFLFPSPLIFLTVSFSLFSSSLSPPLMLN